LLRERSQVSTIHHRVEFKNSELMKLLPTLTLTLLTVLGLNFHTPKVEARARCADFASQEEAKAYMVANGANYLDRDRDGIPCESLPRTGTGVNPSTLSNTQKPARQKAPVAMSGQVTIISTGDGDTLRVNQQGKSITVRVACVDAPETAQQPWGSQSAARLKQLLPPGQGVQLRTVDRDRYGRTVAELFLGNQSVGMTMVKDGMAVVYPQYLNGCPANKAQYLQAEATAKQARRGVWSDPKFVMPWDFRKGR